MGAGSAGFFGGSSSGLTASGFLGVTGDFFGSFAGLAAGMILVGPFFAAPFEGLAFDVALFLGLDLGTGGLLRSVDRRRARGRAGRSWTC